MNTLGMLLQDQGQFDAAAPLFWEALQGARATLGERDPATQAYINSLGMMLLAQGKLDEAASLRQELGLGPLDEAELFCVSAAAAPPVSLNCNSTLDCGSVGSDQVEKYAEEFLQMLQNNA
jgi:hypothetical protein